MNTYATIIVIRHVFLSLNFPFPGRAIGEIMQKDIRIDRRIIMGRVYQGSIFFGFIVFMLCTGNSLAQDVRIDVMTDKTEYFADENLFLLVRFENTGIDSALVTTGRRTLEYTEHGVERSGIPVETKEYYFTYPDWDRLNMRIAPGEVWHRFLLLPLYRNGSGEEPMLVALPSGSGVMKCEFMISLSSGEESTYSAECHLNVTGIEGSPLWGPEKSYWWGKFREGHPGDWRAELEELMSKHADAPYKNTMMRTFSNFMLGKGKRTREPFLGMEGDKSIIAARHYLMQWIFKRPNEFSSIIFMEAIRRYPEARLMVCQKLMNDSAVTNPIVADYLYNSFCKRAY